MIRKVSYKDQVYEYLKKAIITGELKTGEIYSEQQVADQLGVSRTPVREAVIRLCNEHVLEVHLNRGWSVKPITEDDVHYLLQARLALEGYGLRYLIRHAGEPVWDETIDRLTDCQKRNEAYAQDESHHLEFTRIDTEFHQLMVTCTGNPYLISLESQIKMKMEQATLNSLSFSQRNKVAYQEHQNILNKLLQKDEEGLIHAYRKHMHETAEILRRFIATGGSH